MRRLSSLVLFFAAHTLWASSPATLPLAEGSHCVAYKVKKTMFLVSSDEVVGKNCDISAQILPEVGDLYHIEVNVPLRGFNSDNEDRDKDVFKILHGDQRAEMTFKSQSLTGEKWRSLFAKGEFPIEGTLYIGSKSFPLTLQAKYKDIADAAEVDGAAHVRFKDFELDPPKAGGGIVAKAKPEFELYFHLLSHRILGADSIRLGKKQ